MTLVTDKSGKVCSVLDAMAQREDSGFLPTSVVKEIKEICCLFVCVGFTVQSTYKGHVERGPFT